MANSETKEQPQIRLLLAGGKEGPVYTVETGITRIGRQKDNHVVLEDALASRQHAQIRFDGGLHADNTGTSNPGTPNNLIFENLDAPSANTGGVTVDIPSSATWSGLIFENLTGTRTANKYYLKTTNTGVLTIPEVRFRDQVNGTDGNGIFAADDDPGTVQATGTVTILEYFVNEKGIGGDASDGDP